MEVGRLHPLLLLAVLLLAWAAGDVVEPRGRPTIGKPVDVRAQPEVVVEPERELVGILIILVLYT